MRFPGFEEDWEEHSIGNILKIGSGKDYKHLSEGNIPVFGTGGYMTSVNKYLFDGETVCIGRKGTINKPFYFNGKLWTVDTLFFTHSFQYVIPKFLFYVFEEINWLKYNEASGVPSLSKTTIEQILISIPNINEQKKIASILSTIDERIQTQNEIIEHLQSLKKGLLRTIFSQKKMFNDEQGNNFPNWKFVKLKDVFKRSTLKNNDNKLKYVLTNSALYGIVGQNEYFDKDIANQNNLQGYYIVDIDDFVYNPRISSGAPVGPLKRNKLALGVMSPLYTVLKPIKGNLDFFEFYFETNIWYKYMKSIANYGVRHDRMNITISDFENLPIPFPSLKEQTKIVDFLSSISDKIEIEKKLIEKYENQKKYFLQNMFI
jgi:type I restriction enzyme S subunit